MVDLGEAARELRNRLGLSVRTAAKELGISYVHLSNIENGNTSPSPQIIGRFHKAWGIDLYMFAVCKFGDASRFPESVASPMEKLRIAWDSEIEDLIARRRKEAINRAESLHDEAHC